MTAFTGVVSCTKNDSGGSLAVSSFKLTRTTLAVSPGAKTKMPL